MVLPRTKISFQPLLIHPNTPSPSFSTSLIEGSKQSPPEQSGGCSHCCSDAQALVTGAKFRQGQHWIKSCPLVPLCAVVVREPICSLWILAGAVERAVGTCLRLCWQRCLACTCTSLRVGSGGPRQRGKLGPKATPAWETGFLLPVCQGLQLEEQRVTKHRVKQPRSVGRKGAHDQTCRDQGRTEQEWRSSFCKRGLASIVLPARVREAK